MLYRTGALPRLSLDLVPSSVTMSGSGATRITADIQGGGKLELGYGGGIVALRRDGEVLYEGTLGPPSHNDLLLGQACALFGLTVGGGAPDRRLERRGASPLHHVRELGPRRIHWEQPLTLSVESAEEYLAGIAAAMPGATTLQATWHRAPGKPWQLGLERTGRLTATVSTLYVALDADEGQIAAALADRALTPQRIDALIPHNIRIQTHWDPFFLRRDAEEAGRRASTNAGRPITVHECPTGTVTVGIDADDAVGKQRAVTLAKVTEGLFCDRFEVVDLETRQVVKSLVSPRRYGRDIARWAAQAEDRYLAVVADRENGALRGYRPFRAPA